ncbi:acyl-CoA-binding domain-containing protein 5A-like isoform X2 [Hypomesus transpacificus]|uniref:acyl-CoA-binding domain-containing protein 5A-like isoform X2 n=1 Tax=Hypomesus transpacificus TaxID=137520 RepID=UPI001F07E786|nr:acyl-CoA-binding domain-containing protein 5A-like isoform X2 [Hypomesus transpacificus]
MFSEQFKHLIELMDSGFSEGPCLRLTMCCATNLLRRSCLGLVDLNPDRFSLHGPYQPSDDMMMMFYSYYQQVTCGPCCRPRPAGFWDTAGKAKWDAWRSLGEMTREEAMAAYVDDIQLILETLPMTEEVSALLELLGNFYEEVEGGAEEEEEEEEDKRPFTRPFASASVGFGGPTDKPLMEGFGDLWDALQNPTEELTTAGSDVTGVVWNGVESQSAVSEEEETKVEGKEGSSDAADGDDDDDGDDEEDESDEDAEEHLQEEDRVPGGRPDPRLLRVEDWRWRSGFRLTNGIAAPSVSSATNGTHSSLNSEVEEEELACSGGPSQGPWHRHLNGHLSDPRDAELIHRGDSDNEEFCDSMEHLAMDQASRSTRLPSSGSVKSRGLELEDTTRTRAWGDPPCESGLGTDRPDNSSSQKETGLESPSMSHSSQLCCGSEAVTGGNLDVQIAMALRRLQEDMCSVLQRLDNLEVLTETQTRLLSVRLRDSGPPLLITQRPSWWPLHLSPVAVAFTTVWPLFAHWLVWLFLQRRKRRKIS